MSLQHNLTFKYYQDMMVCKVFLDQLVHLEEMVTIVNLTIKGIRDNQDHKDFQDKEMEVWSLLDGDIPPIL